MKRCFGCEQENPDNLTFCGFCGSPLKLGDFLSRKVSEELSTTIRDRSVLETESSIKVFEKAWGWVKTVLSIAAVLVAILGAGIFWKASDLWSSVDKAKQSVQTTAESSKQQIQQSTITSEETIDAASKRATEASTKASVQVNKQANDAVQQTSHLKSELNQQANSVRTEVGHARTELESVNQLRPQMTAMQGQLTDAIGKVQQQQKTLSSTEDFIKQVFSSHQTRFFPIDVTLHETESGVLQNGLEAIVTPTKKGGNTVVYLLIPQAPIEETLQIQYQIYVQPRNSFLHVKNVVIFFWGQSPTGLNAFPLAVSYFPDTSDTDIAHKLSYHDGRVYADDQPMPKFGELETDSDFKGNKWIKVTKQP